MAITENEMLHLKKGEHSYLLLKSPDRFHLIHEDAALTQAKFDRLLRVYPCDDSFLCKLGLHFSAFRPETLRGVVIHGNHAGDSLEFWLGSDVRKYQLALDYSDEYLSDFFAGRLITHGFSPIWTGLDKALIRKVTWSLNGISIACALLFFFLHTPYRLWSILCLLCQFFAIALPLLFPASFTLADDSRKIMYSFSNNYTNKDKGHLLPALVASSFALCMRTFLDFSFRDNKILFVMLGVFILSIIALLLYIWYNKGLKNSLVSAFGIVIAATFISIGTIGQLNYLLDLHPAQSYVAEVSDQYIDRRSKSSSYYCIVSQPDGEPLELSLTRRIYYDIDVGDELTIIYHDGAFGIPFYTTPLHTGDQATVR